MSLLKKKALLRCCGCGGCGGCCWAADPMDPSQAAPIAFDIIAPSCLELDTVFAGIHHAFTPQVSIGGVPKGACGPCTWMLWNAIESTEYGWTVGGYEPGDPLPSPCGWEIAAALVCTAPDHGDAPTETTVACCANARLLMAANNEFAGSRPLTDFTTLIELSPWAAAAQAIMDGPGNLNWGKLVAPSSCSCDSETGMHADFPIGGWVTPVCPSRTPRDYACCEPTGCSLGGAVLRF